MCISRTSATRSRRFGASGAQNKQIRTSARRTWSPRAHDGVSAAPRHVSTRRDPESPAPHNALMGKRADAVVVGSGPNGLAAAITLARAGREVTVYETADVPGGGCRTAELTLPGVLHDVCSTVHPMGVASPFFRSLDLQARGVRWIQPSAPLAHPLDGRPAAIIEQTVDATVQRLGRDGGAWRAR